MYQPTREACWDLGIPNLSNFAYLDKLENNSDVAAPSSGPTINIEDMNNCNENSLLHQSHSREYEAWYTDFNACGKNLLRFTRIRTVKCICAVIYPFANIRN